jgi:UDP-N-acetylmuramate--alanine ligase
MDFKNIKKIYFVGIKGAGMIALVEIFKQMGKEVLGSDTKEKFFTDEILGKLGVHYHEGFDEKNIANEGEIDLVIYSTAYYLESNIELKLAKKNSILMLSYPEAIGELTKNKFSIAVCGTHGKTTTTAMLTLAMQAAGEDPTAIVGSKIKQIGSNALMGKSDFFVIEADEYQDKFQYYNPIGVVLTSLDYDHPDYFKSFEEYKNAFKRFAKKIPKHGFLVVWGGSADTLEIAREAQCKIIVYDNLSQTNQESISRIKNEFEKAGKHNIDFLNTPISLNLKVPGKHNLLNATAALAVCQQLKLDEKKVKEALENYEGTTRRFEYIGECNGATVIDDYAHHPEEIKATLKTVQTEYPGKKIICVFHPHTFTRTKVLFSQFAQSFDKADEIIILDIFGSAREKQGGVSSKELAEEIKKFHKDAENLSTIQEAHDYLKDEIDRSCVVVTMGAGEGDKLAKMLVN